MSCWSSALPGVLLLCLAGTSCSSGAPPPAEPRTAAWDVDRLLEAERSTNVPFVLVTVVDESARRTRDSAVSFAALRNAVRQEREATAGEVVEFLRTQPTRRMVFAKPGAVEHVWPRYSPAGLEEVRELLRDRTPAEIVADQADLDSELNRRGRQTHGEPYGSLPCVLHVLLERGVACGASCKPGLVYLDEPARGAGSGE